MFDVIGTGRGHCRFCGNYGPVATLFSERRNPEDNAVACEKCIRAAVKAADLLKVLRQAKAPPQKAHRTSTKRAPAAPRTDPGPLVPSDYSPVAEVAS